MIKIKKARIKNLGRLVGEHEIDFSALSTLTQVDGENRNTGGSSGSGKTSIFLALEYLFGVNDTPSTVLQSRLTKDPIFVSLDLEIDGKPVTVTREKSGLSVETQDGKTAGSAKVSEEALDSFLGFSRNLLRPMFHKRQGEKGFFLSMTPKETYGFLVEMLDLGAYTDKQALYEEKAKALNEEVKALFSKLEVIKGALESSQNSLVSLEEPKKDVCPRVLSDLESKILDHDAQIKGLEKELAASLSGLKKPILTKIGLPDDSDLKQKNDRLKQLYNTAIAQIKNLEAQKNALNLKINSAEMLPKELSALEFRFEEVKAKIVHLKNKNCPTCLREWSGQGSDTRLDQALGEGKQVAESIRSIKLQIFESKNLPKELEIIEEKINQEKNQADLINEKRAQVENEISELNAESFRKSQRHQLAYQEELALYEAEVLSLSAKIEPSINSLKAQKDLLVKALATGQERLRSYEAEKQRYDRAKAALESAIKKAESQLEEASRDIANKKNEATVAQEAARFLKSYVTQLFFGSMSQIGERASAILKQIPNMNTATISFDTAKETKSGKIKEEVSAILNAEGEMAVPIKSLSGGERAAIDLAVDLAVSEMIESTTGKGIDLLILDEPFDGLDTVCKEQCLEVLRLFKGDRKILLVDHSNETKAAVSNKIKVVRDAQTSRIERG